MKLSKCTLVTAAALTVASFSFVSTGSAQMGQSKPDNATNHAADSVNNGANRTAERLDRTVDNARNGANNGVNGRDNTGTGAVVETNTNANTNATPNTPAVSADAAGIGSIIGQVTEAAVTPGAFDDLAERFTEADRNRLGKEGVVDKEQPELDALATRINDAWKAKYGHAFDIDSATVYNAGFLSVEPGAMGKTSAIDNNNGVSNNAATDGRKDLNTGANGSAVAGAAGGMNPADGNRNTASGRMDSTHVDPNGNTNTRTDSVPNTGAEVTTKSDGTMAGPAGKSGGVDMTAAADQQKATGAENKSATGTRDNETVRTGNEGVNSNLPNNTGNTAANVDMTSNARRVMVRIPASHGLPELQVPFVQEGIAGGWRIDLADNIDGATLQRNLLAHLTAVQGMQAQWPADEADAYRAVSHHVLAALQNVPSAMASGAE